MIKESGISLHFMGKLIIFSFTLLFSCKQKKGDSANNISILWKDGRAVALAISSRDMQEVSDDSLDKQLEVRLKKPGDQPAMAGDFSKQEAQYLFRPLIPFTRGLRYAVFSKHQFLAEVEIPRDTSVPRLLAIYPSGDTVPENLLKIYLVFSHPMREGHSSKYIQFADHSGRTLPNTFLDLQAELWNEESTILTLWLDPGRIKRDLKPNQLFGPPLVKGGQYQLTVLGDWPDQQGTSLPQSYTRKFMAMARDTLSPVPNKWKLILPEKGSMQPLEIELGEPLDYALLLNTIQVLDASENIVRGKVQIEQGETIYRFTPLQPWPQGHYKLQIEARLEDLAGNNLNRLFDLDLKRTDQSPSSKKFYERDWQIN